MARKKSQSKICPNCFRTNLASRDECRYCGADLSAEIAYAAGLAPGRDITFQSNQAAANRLVILLLLTSIIYLVIIAANWGNLDTLTRIGQGENVSQAVALLRANRLLWATIIQLILNALTGVAFFLWIYRAYRNLYAFGLTDLQFTPRYVIIAWFIPLLNLIQVPRIMAEIWRGSATEADDQDIHLILAWWAIYLLAVTLAVWGVVIGGSANSEIIAVAANAARRTTQFASAALAVFIIAAGLLIAIVKEIDRRQEMKARILAGSDEA